MLFWNEFGHVNTHENKLMLKGQEPTDVSVLSSSQISLSAISVVVRMAEH